jgi:anthranilate synthase component I
MKLTPCREEFKKLAAAVNLIAVSMEISTDLDTPVSIYYKLVGQERGFILESVDTSRQFGRYSFIGAEPFVRLQVYKDHLMVQENDRMRCMDGTPAETVKIYLQGFQTAAEDMLLPLANGGAVGYLNYEIASTFDRVRGLEPGQEELLGQLMICRVLVVFDQLKNTSRLICLAEVSSDTADAVYDAVQQKMQAILRRLSEPAVIPENNVPPRAEKVDFLRRFGTMPASFAAAIDACKEHIMAGDIFQIVPSCQFREKITCPPFSFYRRLRQVNPSPYMFYLNFGAVKLVGASPEMLVKVMGRRLCTYPIAGTRRRGQNDAEDAALMAELQADEKECAEHSMLVDLARNDIGRLSEPGTVRVTKLRQVEKFSHVMHMVSEVVGQLKPGYAPMDVLKACFPAGTVSGAPKLRAMELIHELESVPREAYAGTVGYMDFCGNMDMCITLRTIRIEGDEAIIQAGAGIVADSVAENEYREILQKAKASFEVIEEVENHDLITR